MRVPRRVLITHPSAELYGSDRVALESARAFVEAGWEVTATLTAQGPLVRLLTDAGCSVSILPVPVLRKAYLSPLGLIRFAAITLARTPSMIRLLRRTRPDVVYVSTVTVPWWLVLGRILGIRVLAHVHEAEQDVPRPIRLGLAAPLLLARKVVANSQVSRDTVVDVVPRLAARTSVVYNGVPGPATLTAARKQPDPPLRLTLIGRVSPRKGTDVAVAALALLRQEGVEAELDLVGGVFEGYEWFEQDVRDQADAAGVTPFVHWRGVLPDVWGALATADIALVPSRVEPFGNAAVEAMLAGRPVIAGHAQGLREIVRAGENGELATAGDGRALADAVHRTLKDWPATLVRTQVALKEARELYSPPQYRQRMAAVLATTIE